jgi:hypothetical protein
MSKKALHEWRHDLRGPAVLCLIAAFAPSLLAQTAGAGALTGTVTAVPVALIGNALITAVSARPDQANAPSTETLGPVVNLLPPGNFTGSFETACFDSVDMPPLSVQSRLNSEAGFMNEHTPIRRADRQLMGRGMRPRVLAICLLLALPGFVQPASQWVLEKSTLTYHVPHPLHETEGSPRRRIPLLSPS